MLKSLIIFFKGFFIGGTMMVPGVSGGSMAMILGIYNKLIYAISSFTKKPKENAIFLLKFLLGSVLGIVLFSRFVIVPLMENFPLPTKFFFLGAVVGGAPMIFKTAGVKKVSANAFLYPLIGIFMVMLISFIPKGIFDPSAHFNLWNMVLQLIGGIIVAVALILPGISVSHMLLMLGLYMPLMTAIESFNILPFIPLGIGVVLGSLLSARFMEKAMEKFPTATYLIVFGFLIGSVPDLLIEDAPITEILNCLPVGTNILVCLLTAVLGFSFIYFLQKWESNAETGKVGQNSQN